MKIGDAVHYRYHDGYRKKWSVNNRIQGVVEKIFESGMIKVENISGGFFFKGKHMTATSWVPIEYTHTS